MADLHYKFLEICHQTGPRSPYLFGVVCHSVMVLVQGESSNDWVHFKTYNSWVVYKNRIRLLLQLSDTK